MLRIGAGDGGGGGGTVWSVISGKPSIGCVEDEMRLPLSSRKGSNTLMGSPNDLPGLSGGRSGRQDAPPIDGCSKMSS